jgi:RNA polymerase sigma factor (sigma-70 family)
MGGKNMDNKPKYLWVNGRFCQVTEEVYEAYIRQSRKIRYYERELKTERFVVDMENQRVQIIPSREDSLDRLVDSGQQFADQRECVENTVMRIELIERIHEAIQCLTLEEQRLINELFFKGRTEGDFAVSLGISQVAIHKRKEKILKKLRIFFEN